VIKLVIYLAIIGAFIYVGATVKLGKRTFFGHVRAIWHTEEVQDLKDGIEDKAAPAVDRIKRGVNEAMKDDDTKLRWLALDHLGVEVQVPSCATMEPIGSSAAITSGPECASMKILVASAPSMTLDRAVEGTSRPGGPKERVVRKDMTANGWILEVERDDGAPRVAGLSQQVTISGRTLGCNTFGYVQRSEIPTARHACASLRAIAK
jgi:hypothetical protein